MFVMQKLNTNVLRDDKFHGWDENFSSEKISNFGRFLMHAWKVVVHVWKNHHLTEKTLWCKVLFTDELWKTIFKLAKPSTDCYVGNWSKITFEIFSFFNFNSDLSGLPENVLTRNVIENSEIVFFTICKLKVSSCKVLVKT